MVEQLPVKELVVGSNPTCGAMENRSHNFYQKGFIPILALAIMVVSLLAVSLGGGAILYKQGKFPILSASISGMFGNKTESSGEQEEVQAEQLEQRIRELEQKLQEGRGDEGGILKAEIERVRKEAQEMRAEAQRLREKTEITRENVQETQNGIGPRISVVSPSEILSNIDVVLTLSGENFKEGSRVMLGNLILGEEDIGKTKFVNERTITFEYPRGYIAPGVYTVGIKNPDGMEALSPNALTIKDAALQNQEGELTVPEVRQKLSPSVVFILNDAEAEYGIYGSGTGFIIDAEGFILTNEHVIREDSVVHVVLEDGAVLLGDVVGWSKPYDLAIVKVRQSGFSAVTLGSSGSMQIGESVIALGYPKAFTTDIESISTTAGIISRNRTINGLTYLQTDAAINKGNSGGPLVNLHGEVIGIITYGLLDSQGIAYALDIEEAKSIIPQMKAGLKTP